MEGATREGVWPEEHVDGIPDDEGEGYEQPDYSEGRWGMRPGAFLGSARARRAAGGGGDGF